MIFWCFKIKIWLVKVGEVSLIDVDNIVVFMLLKWIVF